ncbi:MAG: ribonuclease [Bacteroidales bacterium]|jgi:ribonuclease HI|nr:ribonuclease [Bacteroidales bacterium]
MKNKKHFYVVWKGAETGVFASWEECFKRIRGYAGAQYMGFATREEALKAFASNPDEYLGKNKKAGYLKLSEGERDARPIIPSLCVDAACSGNPGKMEYRGVETATGVEIFRQGPFEDATNNIGEFLAIVHALAYLRKLGSDIPVYSDSRNALLWVKGKKARTLLKKTPLNTRVFDMIERAEKWLAENDYPNQLLKWETQLWGEIPADFRRK